MARKALKNKKTESVQERAARLDAIMEEFHQEMAGLRKRQRELLKKVMARIDSEKRAEIKSKL
jgi:hypothetical protein